MCIPYTYLCTFANSTAKKNATLTIAKFDKGQGYLQKLDMPKQFS